MTPRALVLPLLLLGTAIAQDTALIELRNEHVRMCRGNDSDAAGCVTAPRQTYAPEPTYPKRERKARHRGTVILWLVVGSDGLPRDIAVSRPLSPDFDAAAIDAVKKWKFSPATKDGKPVAAKVNVEVSFHLY
jgi:TonB family protein